MRCDDCGFAYDEVGAADAVDRLEAESRLLADLVAPLAPDVARRRPAPSTWSPLEYACHVRDVLLVQRERVLLARRVDQPEPDPMGRDERADHDGYAEQDPADVVRQLLDAADLLARAFRRLPDDAWSRTLVYGFPERSVRDLRWVAAHTVHELVHHRADIATGVSAG